MISDITPRLDNKSPEDQELYAEVFEMLNRYATNLSGISYQAQGYAIDALGTLPAWLVDEHKMIHSLYMQAQKDRR